MYQQLLSRFRAGEMSKGEFLDLLFAAFEESGSWGANSRTVADAWIKRNMTPEEQEATEDYHIAGGVTETVADVPIPGQAMTTPWGETVSGRPTQPQAFRRFLSLSPFAQSPALSQAASALYPLAQTQFGLQPPISGEGAGQFGDFLSGGNFLRGDALQNRLNTLAGILPQLTYDPEGNPVPGFLPETDPMGAALGERFGTPGGAFEAFSLPTIQQATGVGRDLLTNAFNRFQTRWQAQNPNASAADVARLFRYGL